MVLLFLILSHLILSGYTLTVNSVFGNLLYRNYNGIEGGRGRKWNFCFSCFILVGFTSCGVPLLLLFIHLYNSLSLDVVYLLRTSTGNYSLAAYMSEEEVLKGIIYPPISR